MKMLKIVVFVPIEAADRVRAAMADAGAGRIGNYSHASFSTHGQGRFIPLEGSNPAIGKIGELEITEEEKIEVLCHEHALPQVIKAIRAVHPYEEPAIESYTIEVH